MLGFKHNSYLVQTYFMVLCEIEFNSLKLIGEPKQKYLTRLSTKLIIGL